LRRTKSGRFTVDGAITIDELKTLPRETVEGRVMSLPDVSRLRGA
jgi:tRNA pseudouridine55 synthase